MNKIWKTIISVMLLIVACFCFTACNDGESGGNNDEFVFKSYGDDGYYTLVKYQGDDIALTIPASHEGKKVGRIKANAFSGNKSIQTLVIPNCVEEIDQSAFGGMSALKELTVPFIGQFANAETSLNDNNVTGEKKAVDMARTFGYMFATNEYDGSIKLTQTYNDATETDDQGQTKATGVFDFYMPALLKKVNIAPANAGYGVPAYAFFGNSALQEITFNANVKIVGDYAMYNCQALNTLKVSQGIEKIGDYAFYGCRALGDMVNGKGLSFSETSILKEIGGYAFAGIKVTNLQLPSAVESIGKYAFASIISGGDIAMNGRSELRTVVLPASIKTISEGAFYMCDKLVSVSLNASATDVAIGAMAFANCESLVSFDSASVNTIDLSKVSSLGSMAFGKLNSDITFTVVTTLSQSQLESGYCFFNTKFTI
ncbi:MAG: leucine-rich repeat protein [Clostridia bacterium]|nr:leucine-rich repeat protein [Clostridia bacterium]